MDDHFPKNDLAVALYNPSIFGREALSVKTFNAIAKQGDAKAKRGKKPAWKGLIKPEEIAGGICFS